MVEEWLKTDAASAQISSELEDRTFIPSTLCENLLTRSLQSLAPNLVRYMRHDSSFYLVLTLYQIQVSSTGFLLKWPRLSQKPKHHPNLYPNLSPPQRRPLLVKPHPTPRTNCHDDLQMAHAPVLSSKLSRKPFLLPPLPRRNVLHPPVHLLREGTCKSRDEWTSLQVRVPCKGTAMATWQAARVASSSG